MVGDHVAAVRTPGGGRRACRRTKQSMFLVLVATLPGCMWNWNERDRAELCVGFMEWTSVPAAAAGPQPFATRDGECYYAYKGEVRSLRDDALAAECDLQHAPASMLRTTHVHGCDLACLVLTEPLAERPGVLGLPRTLLRIDDASGAQRVLRGEPGIVEMSTAPQEDLAVLALETAEDEPNVYSVVATCDLVDGHECVRQAWEVRDMRGLDSTPDGESFVCAGYVDGVQGVYLGKATIQAPPTLLARNVQYPSISEDGSRVAMSPCDPSRLWGSAQFLDRACIALLDIPTGQTRQVEIGRNDLVCGTRFVGNPTRLLVYGMHAQDDGRQVWWVIWEIEEDQTVRELRKWEWGRGEVVP